MEYNPDDYDGAGDFATSPHIGDAIRFETQVDAWDYWRQPSKVRPLRPDGRPNRPLTAMSVAIEEAPDG